MKTSPKKSREEAGAAGKVLWCFTSDQTTPVRDASALAEGTDITRDAAPYAGIPAEGLQSNSAFSDQAEQRSSRYIITPLAKWLC